MRKIPFNISCDVDVIFQKLKASNLKFTLFHNTQYDDLGNIVKKANQVKILCNIEDIEKITEIVQSIN